MEAEDDYVEVPILLQFKKSQILQPRLNALVIDRSLLVNLSCNSIL